MNKILPHNGSFVWFQNSSLYASLCMTLQSTHCLKSLKFIFHCSAIIAVFRITIVCCSYCQTIYLQVNLFHMLYCSYMLFLMLANFWPLNFDFLGHGKHLTFCRNVLILFCISFCTYVSVLLVCFVIFNVLYIILYIFSTYMFLYC